MSRLSKKIVLTFLFSVIIGSIFYWWTTSTQTQNNDPCAFCNEQILQAQTFYEDNLVRGMCTHKPLLPYHCLVVIKRHIENIDNATDEEIAAAFRLIKKINAIVQKLNGPSSYLLLQKNGREAGQTVPHVHIHYLPTKQTDCRNTPTFGLLWPFIRSPFQRAIPKDVLAADVAVMKKEFLMIGAA